MKPIVGITLGDPSGIGPEVTATALARRDVARALKPVVFGDETTLARHALFAKWPRISAEALVELAPGKARRSDVESARGGVVCAVTALAKKHVQPGKPSREGGRAQYAFLVEAIRAAKEGWIDAICTAPVSKEGISLAGIPFMGHTEVLAEAFGVEVMMLMDGPRVRIALATNHVPLADVPRMLTRERLLAQLDLLHRAFRSRLGRAPRIGVLGLNPHAGEGGLLGREEVEVLAPAIAEARRKRIRVDGPLPADGLFARPEQIPHDVVLALYHDQGLIPAKALDFERTVNVTLGLPVPRTSPDHGTAYALAGRGTASAINMAEALLRAAELARPAR